MELNLEEIARVFRRYQPLTLALEGNRHAAVAMVLRPAPNGPEVVFIERTRNAEDPWSGQMAFPGGMIEPEDESPRTAAERETREEIGIDLKESSYLGRLDDCQGRHRRHLQGIVVSGFVYLDRKVQNLQPNYEVAEIVCEPLGSFLEESRRTHIDWGEPGQRFPGVCVGHSDHQVVWGLTWRFMSGFFKALNIPLEYDERR